MSTFQTVILVQRARTEDFNNDNDDSNRVAKQDSKNVVMSLKRELKRGKKNEDSKMNAC